MYSVLQNKKNIKFKFEKFPYLIIDDALPTDLYRKLSNSFPKYEKIIAGSEYKENFAYRYNAFNSLRDNEISTDWKEFIKFHTSYEFLEEFYSIFGDSIKKIYNVFSKIKTFRIAARGEFTKRAFLNGIIDLTQAEGLNDLINSETEKQFKMSMSQYEGKLSSKINLWRNEIVWLLSKLEALIDFSDEELPLELEEIFKKRVLKMLDEMKNVPVALVKNSSTAVVLYKI